jgi:cyanophycinase
MGSLSRRFVSWGWCLALCAVALQAHAFNEGCPAPKGESAAPDRGAGVVVAIGGALKYDNDAVWRRIVDLAGGDGARFAVFGTASGNPSKAAQLIIDALKYHGAQAEFIPVAPRLKGSDFRSAANDPAIAARVRAAHGVYFSGGSQELITEALYDPSGAATPVLKAIWDVYCSGGVVAGSSAGAAVMSTTMFRDARDVLSVMKFGVSRGQEIDRGLGFVGPGIFIDQHFLKRGRFGRMLRVMVDEGYKLGIGVDENTAAIFDDDKVEVIGYKGVLVADLTAATTDPLMAEFNLRNARLTYLDRGDSYDLKTRVTTPSVQKLRDMKVDPNAPDFEPYFDHEPFYADVLSDTTVVNLMSTLLDNRRKEAVGLAFGAPGSKRPDLGFEFRFRKSPDSLGYYTGAFGGEDYTVMNIMLDITPITLTLPMYRPETSIDPRAARALR